MLAVGVGARRSAAFWRCGRPDLKARDDDLVRVDSPASSALCGSIVHMSLLHTKNGRPLQRSDDTLHSKSGI